MTDDTRNGTGNRTRNGTRNGTFGPPSPHAWADPTERPTVTDAELRRRMAEMEARAELALREALRFQVRLALLRLRLGLDVNGDGEA